MKINPALSSESSTDLSESICSDDFFLYLFLSQSDFSSLYKITGLLWRVTSFGPHLFEEFMKLLRTPNYLNSFIFKPREGGLLYTLFFF